MATKLVGYDSGEESDGAEDISTERTHNKIKEEKTVVDFAAEWDNFEKLIACPSSNEQSYSSDRKSTVNEKVILKFNKNIPPKRVFREEADSDKSDSDMNIDSASDNEQYLGSPTVASDKAKENPAIKLSSSSSSSSSVVRGQSPPDSSSESHSDGSSDENSVERLRKAGEQSRRTSQEASMFTGEVKDISAVERERRLGDIKSLPVTDAGSLTKTCQSEKRSGSRETSSGLKLSQSSSAEEKIRAKLLAIADSPPKEIKKSRSRSPHDRRLSDRRRSPSPKSSRRSRDYTHGHSRHSSRRSRSRSHGRHRRSGSRGRRPRSRSLSRSGGRHNKSRRPHSRDRHSSPHRRRSRERRRSRTRSPPSNVDKQPKNQPLNFKEQLKAKLVNAAQKQEAAVAAAAAAAASVSEAVLAIDAQPQCSSVAANIAKMMATNPLIKANEKPSNLPLNASSHMMTVSAGPKDKVTPQQALSQTMAALHQKAQELTGVAVPSYYNPAAVNPLKYAEQLKKRKLLWSKAPKETSTETAEQSDVKSVQSVAQWTGSSFAADSDGKVAAKFRKLMGIREEDKILLADNVDISKLSEEQRRRQDELFQQLDKEYAFARMTTHTHRGIGLGFQSQGLPDT